MFRISSFLLRGFNPNIGVRHYRLPPSGMDSMLQIGSRRIFDSDQDTFRSSVRRFMAEELVPVYSKEFEKTGKPSKEIWRKFGENGLLGISIKEEIGGIGGTFKDEAIVLEEMGYANCSAPSVLVHSTIVIPYIQNYGTPEQIEKYVKPMVAGEIVGAIAMTEPDAGSDLQGIKTHAKKVGDDYVINGSKVFITNGILADLVIVVAITDPLARSKAHGISLFLLPAGHPGFHKGKNLKKIGCKCQDTAELFFDDVRVPSSFLLGEENKGFYYLMDELPQERVAIGINAVAHAEWMFEETRNYINGRKAFGGTLGSLQTIRHVLAEIKTEIAVTRAFIDECILLHSDGKLSGEMASMAKYWATDLEEKVAHKCLQMHGGWGYMYETPIAKAFLDARVQSIYGGANEVMKELISRSIIKK